MSSLAKRALLLLSLCLTGVAGYFSIVQASDIRTEICESSSVPSLSIASPLPDSIVNQPSLHIQGTALRTDQITIFINGVQRSIVSIGPSDVIDTTVSLTKDTNSISLHAYYSCNQASTVTTFVVTYEPSAPPSSGSSVVTVMPSPGTISRSNSIISTNQPSPTSSSPQGDPKTDEDGKTEAGPPGITIDPNTGEVLPSMCENFYVFSAAHLTALTIVGFLFLVTERLYRLTGRIKRRRPSDALKLTVRCAVALLTGFLLWSLTRMVINCV